MITYGSHAQILIDNGYAVIPIAPGKKRPGAGVNNWTERYNLPPERYSQHGIGVVCGSGKIPVYAIDIDIVDAEVASALVTGCALVRIGRPPKRLFLFRGDTGLRKRVSKRFKNLGHVDFLGAGEYFVAYGIHPDTKRPYSWPEKSIVEIPAAKLPVLGDTVDSVFQKFNDVAVMMGYAEEEERTSVISHTEYDPDDPLFAKVPIGIDIRKLNAILATIDPDCGREQWRNVGFAIHHETSGSADGFELWDSWSARGAKYRDGETAYQWSSFGRYRGEPITAAYLLKLGVKNGVADVADVADDFFHSANWSSSRFSDTPAPIEMIIEKMLPRGIVSMIFSAGGAGKSTLMLYLAIRITLAETYPRLVFMASAITGGTVVILTAEDPDIILNQRYIGIIRGIAAEISEDTSVVRAIVDEKLRIVSTFGQPLSLFGLKNEKIRPTPSFRHFLSYLEELRGISLVIIDTKTRFSPGEDEGNVAAAQEIAFYELIARRINATVMLLHHTSKKSRDGSQTGQQAYRGVTALFDHTRASWYFRPITEIEAVNNEIPSEDMDKFFVFENAKNNYVIRHAPVLIKRDGYSYTCRTISPRLSREQKADAKKQNLIDDVVCFLQRQDKKGTLKQIDIIKWGRELGIGRSRVLSAIEDSIDDGLIKLLTEGRVKMFELTETGKKYGLEMGGRS